MDYNIETRETHENRELSQGNRTRERELYYELGGAAKKFAEDAFCGRKVTREQAAEAGLLWESVVVSEDARDVERTFHASAHKPAIMCLTAPQPMNYYAAVRTNYQGLNMAPKDSRLIEGEELKLVHMGLFAGGWSTPPIIELGRSVRVEVPADFDPKIHYIVDDRTMYVREEKECEHSPDYQASQPLIR